MAGYDSYLLLENGGKLLLEDGSGAFLLEIAVPIVPTVPVEGGDDTWYTYAAQLLSEQRAQEVRRVPPPLVPDFELVLDEEDWTEEQLAYLLAVDVLA